MTLDDQKYLMVTLTNYGSDAESVMTSFFSAGGVISRSTYVLRAVLNNKVATVCSEGISFDTYLKGGGTGKERMALRNQVLKWVDGQIKDLVAKKEHPSFKPSFTAVQDAPATLVGPDNHPPSDKSNPIPLREATAVGQWVKGTSNNDYQTIAVNPRVKVAVRADNQFVSFRVEMNSPLPVEKILIQKKVSWKEANVDTQSYGSKHLQIGDIPLGTVLGAFIMGLGIKFDSQLLSVFDLLA